MIRAVKRNCRAPGMLLLFLLAFSNCQKDTPGSDNAVHKAQYAGREACVACHQQQDTLFALSDHDLAMTIATGETVLGDFNNAKFTHQGITSKFYRKNGKFYVFTEGTGGELQEFQVKYTFGVRPLQQYLVEFPGGRLQCLPLCWDARPKAAGGQRWFHTYPDERIAPDDILYWTRISQNWNFMCAECHSTNLKKNFDPAKGEYNTTWSEIDVSCEACHGPGSRHIEWAKAAERGEKTGRFPGLGLVIRLKDRDKGLWVMNSKTGIAERTPPGVQPHRWSCAPAAIPAAR